MRILLVLAAPGLFCAGAATAADFDCRPATGEIACSASECTATSADESTPMELSRTGNRLSICAGESCSEGLISMRRTRGGIDFLYADVRLTGHRSTQPLAVIYDPKTRTALARWGGYAMPFFCGATE